MILKGFQVTPDLVLVNGNFLMTDNDQPTDAIAIHRGTIVALGRTEEILGLTDETTRVVNLKGRTVIPGFNDAHTHFLWMGVQLSRVQLDGATSMAEVIRRLGERAQKTPRGQWILGHGWDEHRFADDKRYPTKHDLDHASRDHPILIVRVCGHMASANSLALELSKPSREIEGVDVDRDTGELTGLLFEGAARMAVYDKAPSSDEMSAGVLAATREAHRLGVTSITDFVTADMVRVYQELHRKGELKVRVALSLRCSDTSHSGYSIDVLEAMGIHTNFGDETLKIASVKLAVDGSLGAHTALLYEAYSDDPEKLGTPIDDLERIRDCTKRAHIAGFQVAIHAIGDKAVDHAIETIDESLKAKQRLDHRHRIEHCELTSDRQLKKISELGIVASMQPNFVGVWGRPGGMYETRLGKERLERCNMYRWMLDNHVPVCFGSDGMPFNPMLGVWSAVTHPTEAQRLTVAEALQCYTLGSAYASFDDEAKGTLEVGKLADMAVLSANPLTTPEDDVRDIEVEMTIFNGEIVYQRDG